VSGWPICMPTNESSGLDNVTVRVSSVMHVADLAHLGKLHCPRKEERSLELQMESLVVSEVNATDYPERPG